jgi:peptidoglycan/xylan/chitin deacetylase (PgdA/CDA1 family)
MLRSATKRILRVSGKLIAGDPAGRVIVLCYHSVHPSNAFRSATPDLFDQHLEWIRQHCDVVPLTEVLRATVSANRRPTVSITFDDGHEDNHRFAFPRLKDHGLSATFFLTAGLIEKDPAVVGRFQRLRHSDYESIRPMEWTQVVEMLHDGMDVGAHSYSHKNLVRLGRSELRHELVDAKHIIEERTGEQTISLAYPFGKPRIHFTDQAVEMAQEAGYRLAAAIVKRGVRRTDSVLRIPRMYVSHDSVDVLREKILGYWDAIGILQEHSPLWLSRLVSPTDFTF